MNIHNTNNKGFNYTDYTRQLFDAMLEGKTIKSITCMAGLMNKNNPDKDFVLTNVKALDYTVGLSWSQQHGHNDYVDIEPQMVADRKMDGFYMNWVRSFEL